MKIRGNQVMVEEMMDQIASFDTKEAASFTIKTLNLPSSWEFIYQNRKMLLKVDQFGPIYAQLNPPSDIMLFRREAFQKNSSWLFWLKSDSFDGEIITNFFRPLIGKTDPAAEPEKYSLTYNPVSALYTIEYKGLRCRTEFFLPINEPAICCRVSLTNLRSEKMELSVIPALRPYVNPAMLAPWDRPEWYLRSGFCHDDEIGFWTQLMNMNSQAEQRRTVALWSKSQGAIAAEIHYERFVGQGGFENPDSVIKGPLCIPISDGRSWGVYENKNTVIGYPPVYSLQYNIVLAPNQTETLHQVLCVLPNESEGNLTSVQTARRNQVFLDEKVYCQEKERSKEYFDHLFSLRKIDTPDSMLNRYGNEWLPLQLDWVCSLDRGWPSGMRGSRDSAQDFCAMAWLDSDWSRKIIEMLLSCQRTDGWFPRQYSAMGRKGKHDLREYVDAGCFVLELVYEYLGVTGDYDLLTTRQPWLDSDQEESLLHHILQAMEYYIRKENIGPHGLCKIREGDWMDSVNRAGVKGLGESVTVTNQAIMALTWMVELLEKLIVLGRPVPPDVENTIHRYEEEKNSFTRHLRSSAWNSEGYYSSLCNDDGLWIFSEKDPDGQRRVYGPANWFSIISGVAVPDQVESILKEMAILKCDSGYRLFGPPMGEIPIKNVGRIATGDQAVGMWENGNVYNHGSHGFLGRALSVAGQGDLLYEVIQYLLPYDQSIHPVSKTKTAPYAVVNCWQNVPGYEHHGGLTSLTGSIAYGLRMAYNWMLGIRVTLDGLIIDPCIPSSFKKLTGYFTYRNHYINLEIYNPDSSQAGVKSMIINGTISESTIIDPFSKRKVFMINDQTIMDLKQDCKIVITL
jgi:hypothetical protein